MIMKFFSTEFNKDIIVNRNKKIRKLSLKVCKVSGSISINAPMYISHSVLKTFFYKNLNWISKQINECVVIQNIKDGLYIPVEGDLWEILVTKSNSRTQFFGSNKILVPMDSSNIGKEVQNFLIRHCKSVMIPIILKKSDLIKKKLRKISFKDTKSRWGSCTSNGTIMLNWRLIMAPPSVYKYVIIHELSHLVHMDHSSFFWRQVSELHPNYRDDRDWLRTNGKELRKYIF